ncbi:YciI family protein [Nevskia soli]|uniref:YciI family protein n=1 Tax=Nevskia soli TaxID=418856 RepID=UPI0004A738E5|nr:YciI family protein [Nevskia soli]
MQYLLLIYVSESDESKMDKSTLEAVHAEYGTFTQGIIQGGQFKGGERLRPVATASTVRIRNGKTVITDGPFAETREQLGGFYMIEAKNLDEATAIAARIPGARHGSIEVRPIWPMS